MKSAVSFENVLSFWFEQLPPEKRFSQDDAVDELIREHFSNIWQAAAQGELWSWRQTLLGRLAEIIVLDQFSRHIWRGDAKAFSQDGVALVLSQEMLSQQGFDDLNAEQKQFALLPMMHSESLVIQDASLLWFEVHCSANVLDYAQRHRDIIAQFQRFPHRNRVLGRISSEAEILFLQQPNSSF